MHCCCSFLFYHLGLAGAHHHPNVWHAGDNTLEQSKLSIDWGVYQLIAVSHRPTIDDNLFLSSIMFGRHALHHMFPTVDLCYLPLVVPIFEETLKEFKLDYLIASEKPHPQWQKKRTFGFLEGWFGFIQQVKHINLCFLYEFFSFHTGCESRSRCYQFSTTTGF
jgi:hypothetical protein